MSILCMDHRRESAPSQLCGALRRLQMGSTHPPCSIFEEPCTLLPIHGKPPQLTLDGMFHPGMLNDLSELGDGGGGSGGSVNSSRALLTQNDPVLESLALQRLKVHKFRFRCAYACRPQHNGRDL